MFCREIKGRQSKKYNLCIYTDILICDTFFLDLYFYSELFSFSIFLSFVLQVQKMYW